MQGANNTNGTPVQIYTGDGTNAQQRSVNTDVTGGGTSNGTQGPDDRCGLDAG